MTSIVIYKAILSLVLSLVFGASAMRPDVSDGVYPARKYTSVDADHGGKCVWKQSSSDDLGLCAAVSIRYADGGATHEVWGSGFVSGQLDAGNYTVSVLVTYTCKPTIQAYGPLSRAIRVLAHTEQGGLRSGVQTDDYAATTDGETRGFYLTFAGTFTAEEVEHLAISHECCLTMDNECDIRESMRLIVRPADR